MDEESLNQNLKFGNKRNSTKTKIILTETPTNITQTMNHWLNSRIRIKIAEISAQKCSFTTQEDVL